MVLSLNFLPVTQWTHRQFTSVDPWAKGQPVTWSVIVCKMVGESFLNASRKEAPSVPHQSNQLPKPLVAGIFSPAHKRYRILPLALQDLWREGLVADKDLPWLLHHVEGPLRTSDYPPTRLPAGVKIGSGVCAALSLLSCGSAGGFVIGTFFAIASCLCLVADLYLRERRKRLARAWLRLLSERQDVF